MDTAAVTENLERVRERISRACAAAGRAPESVGLVAVSKRIADDLVVAACAAGQLDLGENRLQDALARQEELSPRLIAAGVDPATVRWHFIGHLQGNKAARTLGRFHLVHGLDSLKLANRLSRLAVDAGRREPILAEVNISGEAQKHGFSPTGVMADLDPLVALPGLDLRGFMGMTRRGADAAELHRSFALLRGIAEEARVASGLALPELSMGMSDDFEIAIAEGATLVRVGSAIFGPRG